MTSKFDLGNINDLHGAALPNGMHAELLPKEIIELNIEIAINHPKLQKLLMEKLREDAYDWSVYFGIIFAYCGIALDGNYPMTQLCDQASRALINKREAAVVSIDTVPSSQALIQHLINMKEVGKEVEIIGNSKNNNSNDNISNKPRR